MIIVIDYDAGNTANVLRALEKIGVTAELSADKEKILAADGLILPGQSRKVKSLYCDFFAGVIC